MTGRTNHRRRPFAATVAAVVFMAASALAQPSPSADPRARYQRNQDQQRDRPRTQQQFEESLRKFESDELPERLEGIAEMGQVDKKDEPRAVAYLLGAANDPNLSVRAKAIDTLGQMRATDATTALVQRLFMRDTDDFTRRRILGALGRIGDPRAVDPLLDFANGRSAVDTRAGAIYALGEIGDRDALKPLEEIASGNDDPKLRAVAKSAIQRIEAQPPPTETPPALIDPRGGPPPGEGR